jgi:dephospho-CoA kinase
MEFNEKWTKEVNDEYRQMIKEKKSTSEILSHFGDLMKYNPKKKYSGGLLTYETFMLTVNEIKMHPNYNYFTFEYIESKRYKDKEDILCHFSVNDIQYILLLEYLIENNSSFNNQVVYNVFFTTKIQYDNYIKRTLNLSAEEMEKIFDELQENAEKETNKGDIIKIFNSLSYILLKMKNRKECGIYMISETNNTKKFHFYKKSIEDSFDNFELTVDVSKFLPGKKSYYYKIEKTDPE